MAGNKIITQYDLQPDPSSANYFLLIDDGINEYRSATAVSIAALSGPVTSVNTKVGDVVLTPDDLNDTSTVHKFVSASELSLINLLSTSQGSDTFLSGDGVYRTPTIADVANIGTGDGLYASTLSNVVQLKSIKPGTNVTIDVASDSITINSLGGGSGTSANMYYTGASPSNVTVGALAAGSALSGKTVSQILESMLVTYLAPSFTSFSIVGQPALIEVGVALSGSKTFNWSTSNSSNVAVNSINIRDQHTNTLIDTGAANTGTDTVSIGTISNTSPISQSWRAEGTNTQSGSFNSSSFTVSSLYPFFYGKSTGVRPTANQALINGGTKVVSSSSGAISVSFASGSSDFLWFAIPSTSANRSTWFITALNNGAIGGAVSSGGNLFPDPVTVTINSPSSLWSGVSYKIYISNYQTAVSSAMTLS
ncbi:MAG: hypothetical protein JSS79_05235 [Bacteroidetes bacterium]|nr:hypothetical protein [Bacteroidota bacterium]